MKIKLTYFKSTGKYYTEAECESDVDFFASVQMVRDMAHEGRLPGLSGRPTEFDILMEGVNWPPHLIKSVSCRGGDLDEALNSGDGVYRP